VAASIRFNSLPGPLQITAGTVALSNFNNTGVLGWHWELLDRPIGSAAVIAAPFAPAPSFTADVPGSYRVRLRTYVDAARTILDASDIQIAFILRAAPFAWRQPAAGETTEVDPVRGWATAREVESIDTHGYMIGGLQTAFDRVPTIELGGGVFAVQQGGTTIFRFNGATAKPELPDGSAASPSLVFQNDPDTGVFHPVGGAIAIASDGNEVARFTTSGTNRPQIRMQTGTAPDAAPHYSFASATTTGMTLDGGLAFYAEGVRPLLLTGVAGVPRAIIQPGTAGNPSLSFEGDQTTGIFRPSAGVIALSTNGAERARFSATNSILSTHWLPDATNTRNLGAPTQRWNIAYANIFEATTLRADVVEVMTDGSAGAPSIRWGVFGDNGFFNAGADRMGVSVDGVEVMRWRNVTGTNPKTLLPSGSLTHPSIGFIGDEDTGFWRPAADTIAVGAGGSLIVRFLFDGTNHQSIFHTGTAAKPSIAFDDGFSTAGFYMPTAGIVGFVAGAQERWRLNNGAFTATSSDAAIQSGVDNQALLLRGKVTNGVDSIGVTLNNQHNLAAASGVQKLVRVEGTIQQSGTAGYAGLEIDISESATGSGNKHLLDVRRGGSLRFAVQGTASGRVVAATDVIPSTNNTHDLGLTTAAWRDGFINRLIAANGSAAAPSLTFASDTGTGIFYNTATALAHGGTEFARFAGVQSAGSGIMEGIQFFPSLSNTGTAGFDAFIVNVIQPLASGTGAKRLFVLKDANTTRLSVASGTGQMRAMSGSATAPTYSFIEDSTDGMFNPVKNQVAIATNGVTRITVTDASIIGAVPFLQGFGTASAPTYSFNGEVTSGMYRSAANTLGFSTSSTLRFSISTTQVTSTLPFIGPVGSVTAPTYSFTGDTDTGIYRLSAGQMAVSSTGTLVAHFTGSSSTTAHLKFWNGQIAGTSAPETNALYAKNVPSAWLKAFAFGIDDRFGIASVASDGGTPAAAIVTFHNAATSAFTQAIITTAGGTTNTTARWATVDTFSANSCRVRHFQWNGSAIVQVAVAGDWSLQRFASHTS
jgi:hypothetical protein